MDTITYRFSEDDAAMFGPDPENLEGVNVKASYVQYKALVYNELIKAYPDVAVSVGTGPDTIQVDGRPDHEEVPWIEAVIHRLWESWDWIVEK